MIPIQDPRVWQGLSFMRNFPLADARRTGKARASLVRLDTADGQFLDALIHEVAESEAAFPFDEQAWAKQTTLRVQRGGGDVIVSVPVDTEPLPAADIHEEPREVRESIRVQALPGKEPQSALSIAVGD